MMDAVAPSLIIGYAVGRLGCQFAGDGDWGIVNELSKPGWFILPDWAWAYDYPHNVINSMNLDPVTGNSFYGGEMIPDCGGVVAVGGAEPEHCTRLADKVFPTPLYEAFLSFLIFAILWMLRKRVKITGMLFFIYLIFNGIERFFIEGIRVNEHYNILGVNWSMSQFIALGLFLIGLMGFLWLKNKNTIATNETTS
jgi:prolipoprotein diacylglyceryltransferase